MTTTITTRSVAYPADGLTMTGHLALPAGTGRRPALLTGPEGPGLNDFQRRRADALAELGYVAPAFDINGGRWFTEPQEMLAHVTPLLAAPTGYGTSAMRYSMCCVPNRGPTPGGSPPSATAPGEQSCWNSGATAQTCGRSGRSTD